MSDKEEKFTIGIGALIEDPKSGKILLLHRAPTIDFANNQWDDVGGRMRQFESPEETLRREVKEETGISQLVIIKPIDVSLQNITIIGGFPQRKHCHWLKILI